MSFRSLFLIVVSLPLLGGCAEVFTSAPLGETPIAVSSEDWEGIWIGPEETYVIQVIDEETGTFLVSTLDPEKSPPEVEPMEFQLSKTGGWYFGNWEVEPGEFSWVRVKREGESILVWFADAERFIELVDQGVLPGEVRSRGGSGSSGEVFIGPLTEEHLDIITESTEGILFIWDEPLQLHRVKGPDGIGSGSSIRPESPASSAEQGRYLITAENLAPYDTLNAHEAIRRLRRFWLQGTGGKAPRVFVDGKDVGEPSVLEEYPANQLTELRFIPPTDAMVRFGPDYGGGVIELVLKEGMG